MCTNSFSFQNKNSSVIHCLTSCLEINNLLWKLQLYIPVLWIQVRYITKTSKKYWWILIDNIIIYNNRWLYINSLKYTSVQCLIVNVEFVLVQDPLLGPTQVKCWLLISSIFYVMNFWHFLEMLEFNLWHFWKMSEIHYIKNARNQKSKLTWGGPYWSMMW